MIINNQPVQQAGKLLSAVGKVLVMVHGRGDSAKLFIGLSGSLNAPADEFAFLAIQAIQNTWSPYSFLAAVNQNEPNLSLSLSPVSELFDDLIGESLTRTNYKGNFEGTPIFIGASDHDPHVLESRIEESQVILESMGAN